jgi:hypothetical protein
LGENVKPGEHFFGVFANVAKTLQAIGMVASSSLHRTLVVTKKRCNFGHKRPRARGRKLWTPA